MFSRVLNSGRSAVHHLPSHTVSFLVRNFSSQIPRNFTETAQPLKDRITSYVKDGFADCAIKAKEKQPAIKKYCVTQFKVFGTHLYELIIKVKDVALSLCQGALMKLPELTDALVSTYNSMKGWAVEKFKKAPLLACIRERFTALAKYFKGSSPVLYKRFKEITPFIPYQTIAFLAVPCFRRLTLLYHGIQNQYVRSFTGKTFCALTQNSTLGKSLRLGAFFIFLRKFPFRKFIKYVVGGGEWSFHMGFRKESLLAQNNPK